MMLFYSIFIYTSCKIDNDAFTVLSGNNKCGNSIVDSDETCDDGNTVIGDGCNSACKIEIPTDFTGSCDLSFFSACITLTGNEYTATQFQTKCEEQGFIYSSSICSISNLLGVCFHDEGLSTEGYMFYYKGFSVDNPETDCIDSGGIWTPVFSECGNGIIEAVEYCDDANTNNGDGCDSLCQIEPICGNLIVEFGEFCDDGNTINADGCDSLCQVESISAICGDGIQNIGSGESCDTGGIDTSTCNAFCTFPVCGDSYVNIVAGEQCDDGNTINGDGCSSTCQIE